MSPSLAALVLLGAGEGGTATCCMGRDLCLVATAASRDSAHDVCRVLGEGVDVKTVQARMGHAKASHTLDLYAHAIPANDQNAAGVMGNLTKTRSRKDSRVTSYTSKRRSTLTSAEKRERREARRAKTPS